VGTRGSFTPLYNGNISETIWRTANDITNGKTRGYAYEYDALNRITYADLGIKTTGAYSTSSGFDLRVDSYDKNGNIISLYRNSESPSDGLDDLRYTYDSGNKLLKVVEMDNSSYKDGGFKDGTNTGNDYSYDSNGNIISDANKGIVSINYNHLNLPTFIDFGGNNKIEYFYDATGIKQKKKVTDTGNITTTDYAGNYIYENDVLQFFNHAEGYVTPDGSGGFNYVYSYLDHLGNVRLNYSDLDNNGSISTSEILQENNYYPMGLKHKGYNTNIISEHKWKYNGKELQDELDLNWYDLGARNLDHALGRFMNVDPKSEQYNFQSPYAFANNNPVLFVDINGEGVDDWIKRGNQIFYDSEVTSQEQAALKYGDNAEHLDEGSTLTGTKDGEVAYQYTFRDDGTVTDSDGNSLSTNNNTTTDAGTTIIGSENKNGFRMGFSWNAAIGGGLGFDIGFVRDAGGKSGLYFNTNLNVGLGVDIGVDGASIQSTHSGPFLLDEYNGNSYSINGGLSAYGVGTGGAYGGTVDETKYKSVGSRMNVSNFGTSDKSRGYKEYSKNYTTPSKSPNVITGGMVRKTKTRVW